MLSCLFEIIISNDRFGRIRRDSENFKISNDGKNRQKMECDYKICLSES